MRKIQFIELNGLASAISRIKMALCFKVNSRCHFSMQFIMYGNSIRNEQKSKLFQIYPNAFITKGSSLKSLNLIENRLSTILLNDIEVSPEHLHTHMAWSGMKMPYVTHCFRCDTFYKTSFGISIAIINLSALFFFLLGRRMNSNIFTNAFMWAFSWCISLVTHIFGFLIFALRFFFSSVRCYWKLGLHPPPFSICNQWKFFVWQLVGSS